MNLVLFFTKGVSLRTWAMMGMLKREIAVYTKLIQRGYKVSFLTYGDEKDLAFQSEVEGIRVLCNLKGWSQEKYQDRLLDFHEPVLSKAHIIKTNQTYGADLALKAAAKFGTRFVARCGYMWSYNAAREWGIDSPQAVEARTVERSVFIPADRIIVTTEKMRQDVLARMPDVSNKIHVIPNYVAVDAFRPLFYEKKPNTLIYVGRIAPEKNLESVLEAIRTVDVTMTIIGEGRMRPELQEQFSDLSDRVIWEGNVPNSDLPEYLNRAAIFILASRYEGHPKALIEAMACGMPVIAADSPGIREIVSDGNTGILCGPDPTSIRRAVEYMLANFEQARNLGQNARQYVIDHFSLEKIADQEYSILDAISQK